MKPETLTNYGAQKGGAWEFWYKYEKIPEANLQAEFYHECRLLGLPCILEFITVCGRHDLALFDSACQILVCILECKKGESAFRPYQLKRYGRLKIPIYQLYRLDQCAELAKRIATECFSGDPKGIFVHQLPDVVPLEGRSPRRRKRRSYVELDEHLIIRS